MCTGLGLFDSCNSIAEYAKMAGCELKPVESFHTYEGKGGRAEIDGKEILGNAQFLTERGIVLTDEINNYASSQLLVSHVYVAVNNKAAGMITVTDTLRDNAAMAVTELKKMRENMCPISIAK